MLSDDNVPDDETIGIILKYQQSSTGEPRMVFTFDFIKTNQLEPYDEAVSLHEREDREGDPDCVQKGGNRKLYIHQHAFMKVLGATIDIGDDGFTPILFDKEGNVMDPNL